MEGGANGCSAQIDLVVHFTDGAKSLALDAPMALLCACAPSCADCRSCPWHAAVSPFINASRSSSGPSEIEPTK